MNIKGIGTDIVKRDRFKEVNEDFLIKFLNEDELNLLGNLNGEDRIDFISGRWATKESIVKASNKEILYSDISVLKLDSGKPVVYVKGIMNESIHVSISHEKEYTMAFCVIEKV